MQLLKILRENINAFIILYFRQIEIILIQFNTACRIKAANSTSIYKMKYLLNACVARTTATMLFDDEDNNISNNVEPMFGPFVSDMGMLTLL